MNVVNQDPWQSYPGHAEHRYKGKDKGNPHVPEPSTYGFISIFLMIAIVMWFRRKK
jgi:hypothetical protein